MDVMFTGIIRYVGQVVRATPSPAGKRLRIEIGPLAPGPETEAPSATNRVWGPLSLGASMAVDGACLTVSAISGSEVEFDVVPETLSRSTLAGLTPGDRVNLEPALAAGDAWDGHIVQGHVDGMAEVARIDRGEAGCTLRLRGPEELTRQMAPKGSVALAGVSLTLAEVAAGEFSVALIPTTLRQTTLGELRVRNRVNVELDIIGKYVRRYLEGLLGEGAPASGLTLEKLRRAGFA